jgi:hypothetical protein
VSFFKKFLIKGGRGYAIQKRPFLSDDIVTPGYYIITVNGYGSQGYICGLIGARGI